MFSYSMHFLLVNQLYWWWACLDFFCYYTSTNRSVPWHCLAVRKYIWLTTLLDWCNVGMVICLRRDADLHMDQLMPLPLTISCSSISRLVLPFWDRLTWVVPDKRQLNRCCCYCLLFCCNAAGAGLAIPEGSLSTICHLDSLGLLVKQFINWKM